MQREKEQMEKDINNCEEGGHWAVRERQNAEQMSRWRCSARPHNFTRIYLYAAGQDQIDFFLLEKYIFKDFHTCKSYAYIKYICTSSLINVVASF